MIEQLRQAIANRLAQRSGGGNTAPTGRRAVAPGGNVTDPRGTQGILSRGENIYNGGSRAAQRGGPNIGRPAQPHQAAISRRLGR